MSQDYGALCAESQAGALIMRLVPVDAPLVPVYACSRRTQAQRLSCKNSWWPDVRTAAACQSLKQERFGCSGDLCRTRGAMAQTFLMMLQGKGGRTRRGGWVGRRGVEVKIEGFRRDNKRRAPERAGPLFVVTCTLLVEAPGV